jgi:hypothetical protein
MAMATLMAIGLALICLSFLLQALQGIQNAPADDTSPDEVADRIVLAGDWPVNDMAGASSAVGVLIARGLRSGASCG